MIEFSKNFQEKIKNDKYLSDYLIYTGVEGKPNNVDYHAKKHENQPASHVEMVECSVVRQDKCKKTETDHELSFYFLRIKSINQLIYNF